MFPSAHSVVFGVAVASSVTVACGDGRGCDDPQPLWATRVPDGEYVEPSGAFTEQQVNGSELARWFPHGEFESEALGGAGGEGGALGSSERGPDRIPSGRIAIARAEMRLVRSYSDSEGRAVEETYRLVEYDEGTSTCYSRNYPETSALELEQVLLEGVPQSDHAAYEGWTVILSGQLEQDQESGATEARYSMVTFTAAQSAEGGSDRVSWQESYEP